MFGLDDRIATFSGGPSIRIVLAVAVLLGCDTRPTRITSPRSRPSWRADASGRRRAPGSSVDLPRVAPALGMSSLAFGVWYVTAAWSLAPYPF
jgi:hypothetical protein